VVRDIAPKVAFWRALAKATEIVSTYPETPYLVFANWKYREVLLNWLLFARAANVENVIVVSYDRRLYWFLQRRGISSVFVPLKPGKHMLWWRMFIFNALCQAGVDFVHSDADALILRNPLPLLQASPAELVMSQGTVHPQDVVRIRGHVLCAGFFLLRSGTQSRDLLGRALEQARIRGTDQSGFNWAIEEMQGQWSLRNEQGVYFEHRGEKFAIFEDPAHFVSGGELRVTMLSHYRFQRFFLGHEHRPHVVHPLANQQASTKREALALLGLWRLRSDWSGVAFDRDSLALLDAHPETRPDKHD